MENRDYWTSSAGYIWALIGSAIGFANILSFSAKAYLYGGGAFLIPFTIALVVMGIPLLFLEGIIGQHHNLPLVTAYGHAKGRVGKFFGWLAIMAVTTIGGYYTLLTGWTIAYGYFTVTNAIPEDTASFLNQNFLEKTTSIFEIGGFAWFQFVCIILVAIFSWWVVSRNIQSGIERMCTIFLPLLIIMICLCTTIVGFLPGAFTGFYYYLKPDFAVLSSPRLWLDAFGHIFFSLSLGLGIVTGYSRHSDKSINIARSMLWVALGDFIISFVAGFTIFGCIGYLSVMKGIPFSSIVTTASPFEMGFVIFPTILKMFGSIYYLIGPLFFFCVFIAGVSGVFSIVESIAGNIQVEFGKSRVYAVTMAIAIMTCIAASFCFGNGQYLIGALDPMVAGFNMLICGIAQVVVFIWCSQEITSKRIWFTPDNRRTFAYYCLRYIIPVLLGVIFCFALLHEVTTASTVTLMIRWSWFLVAAIIALLLARRGTSITV